MSRSDRNATKPVHVLVRDVSKRLGREAEYTNRFTFDHLYEKAARPGVDADGRPYRQHNGSPVEEVVARMLGNMSETLPGIVSILFNDGQLMVRADINLPRAVVVHTVVDAFFCVERELESQKV